MPSLTFRELASSDLEAVAAMVVRCDATVAAWGPPGFTLPEGYGERELGIWQEDLASDDFWAEVAVQDDTIVGVVAGEPSTAHIMSLFVEPALHGNGIGAVLLGRGEDQMRTLDHPRATVNVLQESPAVRFYERNGWERDGRTNRYEPFDMPTIGLTKSLERTRRADSVA